MNVGYNEECSKTELMKRAQRIKEKYSTVQEDDGTELEMAWDDVWRHVGPTTGEGSQEGGSLVCQRNETI